jgi:hypothetical protein
LLPLTRKSGALLLTMLLVAVQPLHAQDERLQYPKFLQKAYFGLDIGDIAYAFADRHLPSGFTSAEVRRPGIAPRLTLLGYRFSDNVSARITYMRPVNWLGYHDINGDRADHSVWINVGAATLKVRSKPVKGKLSFYGEGGLGLVTRRGFEINGSTVMKDASYSAPTAGAGVELPLNSKWSFDTNFTYVPGKAGENQPATTFVGTGFVYNVRPLSEERVERGSDYEFRKNLVQAAVISRGIGGYGVNNFVAEGAVPIFWGGEVEVRRGASVNFQRNVFHTRRIFSFDVGASVGAWESSERRQRFATVSVYPLFRFTALRTPIADAYVNYSLAGPTLISKVNLDRENTGRSFTFRDYMGLGFYFGRAKKLNAEWNIGHFSNGNVFPRNAGIKIPLTVYLGYAF